MIILKCLVEYKIYNNEEKILKNNIKAVYNDNKLSFRDDNDSIKISINTDNIIMTKENLTSTITFNFIKDKKTEGKYFIKLLNSYVNMTIYTKVLEISTYRIYIEYEIWLEEEYSGIFKYELIIKEM